MPFQLILTSILFLAVLQKANGTASYTGKSSFHRWSDAVKNCQTENSGGFLAKIKSLAELQNARTAFLQHQHPEEYWIGIKYDTAGDNFVWGDGTLVNPNAAFEAIVNRAEQQSSSADKRCLYLTTQDVLVAENCGKHKKYICQVGETADPVEASSSNNIQAASTSTSSVLLPSTVAEATIAATTVVPATTITTTTTSTKTGIRSYSYLTSSSRSSPVSSLMVSPTASLQSLYSSVSSTNLPSSSSSYAPQKTHPTITTIAASHTLSLVEEYTSEMKKINASEPSSLEKAINLTSKLVRKASTSDNKVNILVSFEKLESLALNYASLHLTSRNGSEAEISIERKELGMSLMRVPTDHKSGVIFPSQANTFNESFIREEEGAITLSSSMFDQERYVVCILYKNVADLMPEGANNVDNSKESTIRTRIISCTVKPEVQGSFEEDVVVKLTNTKDNLTATQTSCVFWNFSISTKFDGAWSQKGCKLVQETKERTTCSCNHLTNFAVLMEVGETKISDDHKFSLTLVTYIGLSLSLVGEIITILAYLILLNLESSQSHIRLNLGTCLVIAQLVFMTGIKATQTKTLCAIVAITINYFYLVAFAWMVLEGVMLYLKVVKVFNVDTSTKFFYALAWGIPTMVVASTFGITVIIEGSIDNSMRDDVCWFSFSSGFNWAFVGSVLFACLVNLVLLIRIIVEITRLKDVSGAAETHSCRYNSL